MTFADKVRLRAGVYSAVRPDHELVLTRGVRQDAFGRAEQWKHELLRALAIGAPVEKEVTANPAAADFVASLRAGGWLVTTVTRDGTDLFTVRPMHRPLAAHSADGDPLVLSKFAVLHRDRDELVLESPMANADLVIHHPDVVAAIAPLATGQQGRTGPATRLVRELRASGLAVPAGSEDGELAKAQWQPHELWLHERSRVGDHATMGTGYGRTEWARGRFEPLPAHRPPYPGPAVELPVPDLDAVRRNDITLVKAIENRRSGAVHDDTRPISKAQLAELLYRCVRVRRTWTVDDVEYADRPYPAGGGVHELEVYPVVRRATGIGTGLYHYDAHEHRLRLVKPAGPQVGQLLSGAAGVTRKRTPPQVLLLITARFGRLMWCYEQLGYSLIMKNTGALYQTLYLTATSMGLAACALGGGAARLFNETAGIPYHEEAVVGEFVVGTTHEERT
ncbi:SagB family peptide dehydrogenase [Amycolatopsis lurida]